MGIIQAVVSDPLLYVRPVLLFDMGVVIFVAGSASCELDGLFAFGKVSQEVIVEELASVIAIEAEYWEREGFFDAFDLFQDPCFSFARYGTLFGPSGGDIDEVEGIDIDAGCGFSAMGDGIGFEESWSRFIPLIGFNGYLFA